MALASVQSPSQAPLLIFVNPLRRVPIIVRLPHRASGPLKPGAAFRPRGPVRESGMGLHLRASAPQVFSMVSLLLIAITVVATSLTQSSFFRGAIIERE